MRVTMPQLDYYTMDGANNFQMSPNQVAKIQKLLNIVGRETGQDPSAFIRTIASSGESTMHAVESSYSGERNGDFRVQGVSESSSDLNIGDEDDGPTPSVKVSESGMMHISVFS